MVAKEKKNFFFPTTTSTSRMNGYRIFIESESLFLIKGTKK